MIENAEQKARFAGGGAQRLGSDPAQREKPAEPFRLLADERQRGDRERGGGVAPRLRIPL